VESKTNPSFNGSVPKVALPATEPAKTSATHRPDVQRHFIPSVTTLSNSVADSIRTTRLRGVRGLRWYGAVAVLDQAGFL
jgi:hypothetical protein